MIEININPIAFLSVRWYGIIVALAILTLVVWVGWHVRKARRESRITLDTVFMAALVGIPSGVVVSRLFHVLDLWEYYSQHWNEIIGGMGLTIWGAILGAALGIWVYSKIARIKFGFLSDLITPGLVLAQIVGRIGCTVNGCCHGSACSLPWAVVYTHPETAAVLKNVPVHPTQVYEIIFLALVFILILFLRNRIKPAGSLFISYLAIYSVWRIGIDFIRDGTPFLFGLHQAQVIGIFTLIVTIPILAFRTRWGKPEEEVGEEIPVEIEEDTGKDVTAESDSETPT
jgi:phosphatidylglycerol:prolipoprotein diacylglycerol transferase